MSFEFVSFTNHYLMRIRDFRLLAMCLVVAFSAEASLADSHAPNEKTLTLILGAVPPEIATIRAAIEAPEAGVLDGFPYLRGKLHGQEVVVAITGVSKTNTGMVTGIFIHHFRPTEVIMTGTGSRLNPELRTGDVIIATRTYHHDAGSWTRDGMIYQSVRGPVPGVRTGYSFDADEALVSLAMEAAASYRQLGPKVTANGDTYPLEVRQGIVCTGDLFGVTEEKIQDMRSKLKADIMEMESAALAQVCTQMGVPHIIFRSGSNLTQEAPSDDYLVLGPIAANEAAKFTMHFVGVLAAHRAKGP
jgi:5'-methylthioadenosine/S-adenosylhomocysteine nucleosidase